MEQQKKGGDDHLFDLQDGTAHLVKTSAFFFTRKD